MSFIYQKRVDLNKSRSLSLGKIGIILASLIISIPLWNFPPTRIGYYSQIEICLIMFWGLAAAVGLWLFFLGRKNPLLLKRTAGLPLVWGPLLLGILTLLSCVFHTFPLRDFSGSPHISNGVITFISLGLIASQFSILVRISYYRNIMFVIALTVGLIISGLTIIGSMESPFMSWRYWVWAPFLFPDFLAFVDIALLGIYLYIRQNLQSKIYRYDILAFSILCLIGYYASNKSLGYGIVISALITFGIWLFPTSLRRKLLPLCFFGISLSITLLITFYDTLSRLLPDSLAVLGHITTLMSRTWLSQVTLIDLWHRAIDFSWIQQVVVGKGWGTFANISASNMFLIDQSSLFAGQDYKPSWELVNRDLLHSHNIITDTFHSIGLVGLAVYLYTQYRLLGSLSRPYFFMGFFYLIVYQIQLLFWFQFVMTVPLTLFPLCLYFRYPCVNRWAVLLKPTLLLIYTVILLSFTGIQAAISGGYQHGLNKMKNVASTKHLITEFLSAYYWQLEIPFGAQRQVAIARIYATALQTEYEKSPQELVEQSMRLVYHLKGLPKEANYLANNLAINILSELAFKPETARFLNLQILKTWEELAKDHIILMPYRSDILLPFFNYCQTLGKEDLVLRFAEEILTRNADDPLALWFMGSSLLKNPSRFDEGLCLLYKALNSHVDRFMPVPAALRMKIIQHSRVCSPQN